MDAGLISMGAGAAAYCAFWAFCPVWTRWVDDLHGRNAENNGVRIKIKRGLPCPEAVWAQEYYEARAKRRPWLILWKVMPPAYRALELMGHEIEVQVEAREGGDESAARLREAQAMVNGYGGIFRRMGLDGVVRAMRDRSGAARDWVDDHWAMIQREGSEK